MALPIVFGSMTSLLQHVYEHVAETDHRYFYELREMTGLYRGVGCNVCRLEMLLNHTALEEVLLPPYPNGGFHAWVQGIPAKTKAHNLTMWDRLLEDTD